MLRRIGVPLVRAELDAILNKFDLDGNGMIDLSEFVAMILKFWPDATARHFLQIAATLQSIGFETDAGADGCAVELDVRKMDLQTFMNFCQTSGAHFIPSQQRAIGKGELPHAAATSPPLPVNPVTHHHDHSYHGAVSMRHGIHIATCDRRGGPSQSYRASAPLAPRRAHSAPTKQTANGRCCAVRAVQVTAARRRAGERAHH